MRLELREILRSARRKPGLPLTSILVLAVALGGNAVVFTVVDTVLLRPLPVEDQERLHIAWMTDPGRNRPHLEVSFPDFETWRSESTLFSDIALFGSVNWPHVVFGTEEPYRASANGVSANFFDTLGVQPQLGRFFGADDEASGMTNVVVLSHAFWLRFFGADPEIVGKQLRLDGSLNTRGVEPFTIVGVAPRAFDFPKGAEVWILAAHGLPLVYEKLSISPRDRATFGIFWIVTRLSSEVHPAEARRELDAIVRRDSAQKGHASETLAVVLTPFLDHVLGAGVRRSLWVIQSASLLFLAIASINVSALLLARSLAEDSRKALQVALGASRMRLAGRALLESCLLFAVALGVGASFFWLLLEGLKLVAAEAPRIDEIAVRPSVLWFAAAMASVGALAVALPAAAHTMKFSGGVGHRLARGGAFRRATFENALIVTQIGMASLLLIVAFLVSKGYRSLTALDLGYTPAEAFTFRVTLFDSRYPSLESKRAFIRELIQRLEELPEVQAAGAIHNRPLEFGPVGMDAGFQLEGQTSQEARRNPAFNWQSATPGFLRAAGIDLIEGRSFSWRDDESAPLAVIVSEGMARRFWPGESAIGKRLVTLGGGGVDEHGRIVWQSVVGVAEDARYRELETPRLDVYVPLLQAPFEASNIFIRSEAPAEVVFGRARAEAGAIDKEVPLSDMAVMSQVVESAFRERRLTTILVGVFSAVGLLLATLGVFGAIGYLVVRRARELGVRLAVGAEARNIVVWVLARGLPSVFAGLALGVGVTAALGRYLQDLLFQTSPFDVAAYAWACAVVVAATLVACFMPAGRALRIDPTILLRED